MTGSRRTPLHHRQHGVQHDLPVKIIVIKNSTLGLIKWEQMVFLGNPEYGVDMAPPDFVKFADACGACSAAQRRGSAAQVVDEAGILGVTVVRAQDGRGMDGGDDCDLPPSRSAPGHGRSALAVNAERASEQCLARGGPERHYDAGRQTGSSAASHGKQARTCDAPGR